MNLVKLSIMTSFISLLFSKKTSLLHCSAFTHRQYSIHKRIWNNNNNIIPSTSSTSSSSSLRSYYYHSYSIGSSSLSLSSKSRTILSKLLVFDGGMSSSRSHHHQQQPQQQLQIHSRNIINYYSTSTILTAKATTTTTTNNDENLSSSPSFIPQQQQQQQQPLKINLLTIQQHELETLLKSWKQPKYRAKQILHFVHEKGVSDMDDMDNIPKQLRSMLKKYTTIGSLNLEVEVVSKDGTRKRAYRLWDGQLIESVLMPYEDGRQTACISSQAGCAMGCVFCATGQMGFARQLTEDEIFEQVARFAAELKGDDKRLSNVVMMGYVVCIIIQCQTIISYYYHYYYYHYILLT